MAHNFVRGIDPATGLALAGYVFVSKSGDDSTGDGSPDNPYLTIAQAMTAGVNSMVIGTGRYNEQAGNANQKYRFFYGDGLVVLDGQGFTTPFVTYNFDNPLGLFEDLVILNWQVFANKTSNRITSFYPTDCLIINATLTVAGGNGRIYGERCIAINSYILGESAPGFFKGSIMLGTEIPPKSPLINCYLDDGCSGSNDSIGTNYNAIDPACTATFDAAANVNSITLADPKFVNPDYYDFSVQADSELLGAGQNGVNIGGVLLGTSFSEGTDELDAIIANHSNLTYNGLGEIVITDEQNTTTGQSGIEELELAPYTFDILRFLGKINLLGIPDFVDDVPDVENVPNPNFLSYELRWAGVGEDITQAAYYAFRWNFIPTVNRDAGGVITKSNGQPSFDWANEEKIVAKKFQVRITIKATGQYLQS